MSGRPTRIAILSSRPEVLAQLLPVLERGGLPAVLLPGRADDPATEVPESCDLTLLDVDDPDLSVADLVGAVRSKSPATILALSTRDAQELKVEALNAGASDYITVPFGSSEFLARVQAALRYSAHVARTVARSPGPVHSNAKLRLIRLGGREIRLTPIEWRFFWVLADRPGRIVPHRRILQAVWGEGAERRVHYLRVYMNKLRLKVEPDPSRPRYLLAIPKAGYMFQPQSLLGDSA